jgi:hypothetical protein
VFNQQNQENWPAYYGCHHSDRQLGWSDYDPRQCVSNYQEYRPDDSAYWE